MLLRVGSIISVCALVEVRFACTCSILLFRSSSSNLQMRHRIVWKSVELTRFNLLLLIPTALASSCLPNATGAGQRHNLTNAAGESYPIGFLIANWRSAHLSSAIFEILAEEVMGYNIRSLPNITYCEF